MSVLRVKSLYKRFILAVTIAGFLVTGNVAQAGDPVGDFFKRLGNSIAKAGKDQSTRRPAKKRSAKNPGADSKTEQDQAIPVTTEDVSSSPTATAASTRAASAAPAAKGKRRDAPYGVPVAGKPGFVTSPFAPDAGFVDVRKFPPGTEVKDPYTGKIFLTP